MKHILEVGIYKPGDLTDKVINLDDVDARIEGNRAVFTGHATVRSRFKGQDSSGFYRLGKVDAKRQEPGQVVASRTARLAEAYAKASCIALERRLVRRRVN